MAATGGHLTQLARLSERIDLVGEPLWVTFDTPQSRSLLAGRDAEFVRFTSPRDYKSVFANMPTARRLLKDHGAVEVISTGSAIALSFVPVARAMGIRSHYIESAARSSGPSMTGRVLHATPGVQLYSQYPGWATGKWNYIGSVFDEYISEPEPIKDEAAEDLTLVVALGTLDYRFDRLVESVRRAIRPGWKVLWQIGPNDYGQLPGEVHSSIPVGDFEDACRDADVVVSHSGVGSALTSFDAGKHPILVSRDPDYGEHVDGHQRYIGSELSQRGLAEHVHPEAIDGELIQQVAAKGVTSVGLRPPLSLIR